MSDNKERRRKIVHGFLTAYLTMATSEFIYQTFSNILASISFFNYLLMFSSDLR